MPVILQESGFRLLLEDGSNLVLDTTAQDLGLTLFADPDGFGASVVQPAILTLLPSLFADPDSFGAASIVPGPVNLTITSYVDPDSFGAATVEHGEKSLGLALFVDADLFGSASIVPGPATLTFTRAVSEPVFYQHVLARIVLLGGAAASLSSIVAALSRLPAPKYLSSRGTGVSDGQSSSTGRLDAQPKPYTPKYSKPIRFISILDNLMRR